MESYKSFAVTVQGGSHIKSGTVCQDASNFYDKEHGHIDEKKEELCKDVVIAVVADGHGDSSCFRSATGSKIAVACATQGIKLFVNDVKEREEEEYKNLFKSLLKKTDPSPHRELEKLIREILIKQIVASWNIAVTGHYKSNPFTEEELKDVSEKYRTRYSPDYKDGKYMNHAYGTSLIAVALTPWYWFGFHIGDGRFTVLYEDSSGAQPVPWDSRCYLNVTTSICDEDILDRGEEGVRLYLSLHPEKAPPVAFFCCSDGIDDNYPVDEKENAECLYSLYREIAVTFAEDGYESTCGADGKSGQIKALADKFATKGKGDDTSLAGIVNIEKLKEVASAWKVKMAAAEAAKNEAKAAASAKAKAEAEEREKTEAEAAAKKEARRLEIEAQMKAEAEAKAAEKAKAEAEKKAAVEKAEAEAKTKPVSSPYEATGGTPKPGSSPTGDKVKDAEAAAAKAKAEYEAAAAKARAEYEAAAAKARAAEAAAAKARAEAAGASENPDSKADKEQVAIRVINERQKELLLNKDKNGTDEPGKNVDEKA